MYNTLGKAPPLGFQVPRSLLSSLTLVVFPPHYRPLLYLVSLYVSICSPNSHLSAHSHIHVVPWSLCVVVIPMHVVSAVSACPSMPLQQNQPAASCLFPNFASHRRPTCVSCRKKTDIVLALGEFSAQRHGPRALLYIDLYPACTVNNSFPLICITL